MSVKTPQSIVDSVFKSATYEYDPVVSAADALFFTPTDECKYLQDISESFIGSPLHSTLKTREGRECIKEALRKHSDEMPADHEMAMRVCLRLHQVKQASYRRTCARAQKRRALADAEAMGSSDEGEAKPKRKRMRTPMPDLADEEEAKPKRKRVRTRHCKKSIVASNEFSDMLPPPPVLVRQRGYVAQVDSDLSLCN